MWPTEKAEDVHRLLWENHDVFSLESNDWGVPIPSSMRSSWMMRHPTKNSFGEYLLQW